MISGAIIGLVRGSFEDQIKNIVGDQLCKKCDVGAAACLPFATCNADKVCMKADNSCLQELGIAGRVDVASLLAKFSPGMEGKLDLYAVAGGSSSTDGGGLTVNLLGGALPSDDRVDPCVPSAPAPSPPAGGLPKSSIASANALPGGGAPFHLGVGIHNYFLDRAGWAAYQAGLLCLNVGTQSVPLINSETISILAASLGDLLHGESGQLILALRPSTPPVFHLDEGTFTAGGDIDKPLFVADLKALEIDFYMMVDQRFVRIFTVRTDLLLPFGARGRRPGSLTPVIGDVAEAFTNVKVTNNELLGEPPEELEATFPILLGVALPLLGDALGAIPLPAFAGLKLEPLPGGLTSIDNKSVLAIFANLATAPPPSSR